MFGTPECWAVKVGEFVGLVETELQGCSVFFVTHDTEQSVSLQYS